MIQKSQDFREVLLPCKDTNTGNLGPLTVS